MIQFNNNNNNKYTILKRIVIPLLKSQSVNRLANVSITQILEQRPYHGGDKLYQVGTLMKIYLPYL